MLNSPAAASEEVSNALRHVEIVLDEEQALTGGGHEAEKTRNR
jgi:hypothetical protein